MVTRSGYCTNCQARCGVLAEVEDGRLTAVVRDADHPNGGICAMGSAAPEIAGAPNRLTRPLRRVNGKDEPSEWEPISWEAALTEIVARMEAVRATWGAKAVAFSRPTTSANGSADWYPYLVRLAHRFGTPNLHTTSYLCQWNRDNGLAESYGVGLPNPEFESSGVTVVFGHNAAITNPQTLDRLRAARRTGTKVVVVDPREAETTKFADLWLSPRYGTDAPLILGAIRHLLTTGSHDAEFTACWTNGPFLVDLASGRFLRGAAGTPHDGAFAVVGDDGEVGFVDPAVPPERWGVRPALDARLDTTPQGLIELIDEEPVMGAATALHLIAERAAPWDIAGVAAATGIAAADVQAFNDLIATARPVSYYTWNGWEQHTNSYYTHRCMAVLYALTGSFDRPGGNVIYPSMERLDVDGVGLLPPEQSAKRLGLIDRPLGVPNYSSIARFYYRAILEEEPYPLKMLLSFGSNMLLQNPESDRGRAALQALDFHVHIDMVPTPMSDFADLLLPAATPWESPGLRLGFEGAAETAFHTQYRPPVAVPPGEARSDLAIIFELACRLGYADDFWGGDVHASFDARLRPLGLTLEELASQPKGITVASDLRYAKHAEVGEDGTVTGFATPTGKIELYSERLLAHGYDPLPVYVVPETSPAENREIAEDYPLVLSSIKLRVTAHSQHRGVPSLRKRHPHPYVEIHPDTAAAEGVAADEWIRVETPLAAMRVKVKTTPKVQPGTVVGQAGWWEACAELGLPGYDPFSDEGANYNRLVSTDVSDEVSGGVAVKSFHCRVCRLAEQP